MPATNPQRYIPAPIREELDASGLPWQAAFGKSVVKLLVADRLCKTFPLDSSGRQQSRGLRGDLATVRRTIRRIQDEHSTTR